MVIPIGGANHFTPTPAYRNQPDAFQAGSYAGVFQTAFGAESALTWTLSGHSVTANSSSPRCTGTVEVQKVVVPASDPGRFNLLINGQQLANGGDGTTTGPITVGVGEATVSETVLRLRVAAPHGQGEDAMRNHRTAFEKIADVKLWP